MVGVAPGGGGNALPSIRLDDKVAVITGAAGGLGKAYVGAFARCGASVVGVDVIDEVDNLAASADENGLGIEGRRADLTQRADAKALVGHCQRRYGRVDMLINNAGGDWGAYVPFKEISREMWDGVVHRNLTSAFVASQAFCGLLAEGEGGSIVNVSSRSARQVGWYRAVTPAYISAKAGVIALTRYLAKELAPSVRVNCLVPGFTLSGPRLEAAWAEMREEEQHRMTEGVPLARLPSVEEMASAMVFLASPLSSYITGASLDVNGGSFMS